MRDPEREVEREAEGEAGPTQGAQGGTRSQDPGVTPWAQGRCPKGQDSLEPRDTGSSSPLPCSGCLRHQIAPPQPGAQFQGLTALPSCSVLLGTEQTYGASSLRAEATGHGGRGGTVTVTWATPHMPGLATHLPAKSLQVRDAPGRARRGTAACPGLGGRAAPALHLPRCLL